MTNSKGPKIKQNAISIATLLVSLIGSAQAGGYSNIYFYGDSLTDSGVYGPLPGVGPNDHFSTNPGKVWSQNMGASYGFAVSPAYAAQSAAPSVLFNPIASGNNFATGSARINLATQPTLYSLIPPVSAQATQMLARGPLDPNALYAISGGHNDVFAQISAGSNAAAVAGIITAANDLTTQVARLQSAGARHLIVVGIMDMTKTPIASMSANVPDPVLLGNLVTAFNTSLDAGLAGKNLLYFNTGKMLNTVIASPAAYGFRNVTDAATPESLGNPPDPGKETGYLFADIRHPSVSARV